MQQYHDEEWGVPQHDPRMLWEMLVLEGFQAGLSWRTVLHKREAFRKAFARFDPARVARFGPREIDRLLADPGIVRSRAKIEATIAAAKIYGDMACARGGFRRVLLVLHRRQDLARRRPHGAGEHREVGGDLPRMQAPGLQVRRSGDRLCVDAGGGHRGRPRGGLLPPSRRQAAEA
jgi:DNA-3-methyladenine glycosylase I